MNRGWTKCSIASIGMRHRPRQPCLPFVQENAWSLTSPSNTASYFGAWIPKPCFVL